MTLPTHLVWILLVCVIGVVAPLSAAEPTADVAKSALSKRAYPWYDAKTDSFRPLRPPQEITEEQTQQSPFFAPAAEAVGSFLQMVMWGILGLLIVTALVLIARSVGVLDLKASDVRRPAEPIVELETLEALPEPVRTVGDLLGEAERLAGQESFAEAIVCYYSWQLVQLDRQQAIEVQKGKTNRQYRREVSLSRPDLNDAFSASIRLFEEAFFGKLPVSREAFERVWVDRDQFRPPQRKGR